MALPEQPRAKLAMQTVGPTSGRAKTVQVEVEASQDALATPGPERLVGQTVDPSEGLSSTMEAAPTLLGTPRTVTRETDRTRKTKVVERAGDSLDQKLLIPHQQVILWFFSIRDATRINVTQSHFMVALAVIHAGRVPAEA
jgi:hypothetical protein